MAAAWDAEAIDRCIIQAHYAQFGYVHEEELEWLHIPEDWPRGNAHQCQPECAAYDPVERHVAAADAQRMEAHTPTPQSGSGEREPVGAGSPAEAHTPTELFTDAEDGDDDAFQAAKDGCRAEKPDAGEQTHLLCSIERGPSDAALRLRAAATKEESRCEPGAKREDVEIIIENAHRATANAVASNSEVAVQSGCFSGAPGHQGGGTVQHPDMVTLNAAIWAHLGNTYDALALGGA
jgi:hypothetical protein